MSSEMKKPSKAIACSREFATGLQCGRPIAPVFGCWPEECTQCACRIMATREGFEIANALIDQHYGRLRALVIAADVAGNPWAVKDLRSRFLLLDKLAADIGSRRLMRRMGLARQLSTAGKTTNEVKREKLGHRWTSVLPERAIELRKGGFKTRFIGVAWQVELS